MSGGYIEKKPLVLCNALCEDAGQHAPDELLTGIGITTFPGSVHDDLVDEGPHMRSVTAAYLFNGRLCQLFDDIREIPEDRQTDYCSLSISIAARESLDLGTSDGRTEASARAQEIATETLRAITQLCGEKWPTMLSLAKKMHEAIHTIPC